MHKKVRAKTRTLLFRDWLDRPAIGSFYKAIVYSPFIPTLRQASHRHVLRQPSSCHALRQASPRHIPVMFSGKRRPRYTPVTPSVTSPTSVAPSMPQSSVALVTDPSSPQSCGPVKHPGTPGRFISRIRQSPLPDARTTGSAGSNPRRNRRAPSVVPECRVQPIDLRFPDV